MGPQAKARPLGTVPAAQERSGEGGPGAPLSCATVPWAAGTVPGVGALPGVRALPGLGVFALCRGVAWCRGFAWYWGFV